jgi:hypothetical protein
MKRFVSAFVMLAAVMVASAAVASAQGVTTAAINGVVMDMDGRPVADAQVTAVHQPSGSSYAGRTRADGRVILPGLRVGGPYTVSVSHIGFERQMQGDIYLTLGVASDVSFTMRPTTVRLEGITVTGQAEAAIMSSDRTGAATSVGREALSTLPSISGRLEDITRMSPQSGGNMTFAGQDNRMNNITVDGSYFNNSFGLAGTPGERTGVAPISLAAIEQIQINVAPYDVRQGNFIGAGVNTVTRSGTNQFSGSLYYASRNDGLVGTKAGDLTFDPGTFKYSNLGATIGGPIIQNRLFFFLNYEGEAFDQPGTTFRANTGGETPEGSVTRVLASDLDNLGNFLRTNFGYDPGPYQGYGFETPATRFVGKLDLNVNDRNKVSVRYTFLDSETDVLVSNSSSLGFGTRRTNSTGLNFANSNYVIMENIRSLVGEWNAIVGSNMANNLIIGYTKNDESRKPKGQFFPMVDILEGGSVYTTFGFEPFTPNNELRYSSFQVQNNFTMLAGQSHSLTFGASGEYYESENVFFPGSQSVYTYSSLADFYTDMNDYLANPNRTTSPVTLQRFQVRWANIPGMEKPVQPLEVLYAGIYGQDEWQVNDRLKLTMGVRFDAPFFGNTGFHNTQVDNMTFRDEIGDVLKYSTKELPGAKVLFSPRVGFNFDVRGDRSTQLRGGSGVFTGRPAYVWISNQIGENGMLTGFEQLNNTTNRPFNPDPNHYKPTEVTGAPAASYGLAFTDPNFRFPQLWRSNLGVDQRLPWGGLIGTVEFMYNRDVNGMAYYNANLRLPNDEFEGADNRPRWVGSNRVNSNITSAVVLKNQSDGYSWNAAFSLERPFRNGLFAKASYSYGVARNTIDPGSIAFGSWNNNQHVGNPNTPGVAFASASPGHRFFGATSYRREYFGMGATTLGLVLEGRTLGNTSYTFSGDLNGDGGTSNDLIYIHRNTGEMNFQPYSATVDGVTYNFTAEQQAQAWDSYISQDSYLSKNRGKYAERNAVFLPMVWRVDVSLSQEIFSNVFGQRNSISLRADVLNFTNLLNNSWGQGQRLVNNQPLVVPTAAQGGPVDGDGVAQYRLRQIGGELMSKSLERTSFLNDVYRVQFSVRYNFN